MLGLACWDTRGLSLDPTVCRGSRSKARYVEDGWRAEIEGELAVMIGPMNDGLSKGMARMHAVDGGKPLTRGPEIRAGCSGKATRPSSGSARWAAQEPSGARGQR